MSNSFAETFEMELRCWCHGLSQVRERIDRSVLHKVIKEFASVLRDAVANGYICSIPDTAKKLVTAAKCKKLEKEIAFYILSFLPVPSELTKTEVAVLKKIVDQVESVYGGAYKRLDKKWNASANSASTSIATSDSKSDNLFDDLSFPTR